MDIDSLINLARMRGSLIKPGELAGVLWITRAHLTLLAKKSRFPGQIKLPSGQIRFQPCEGLKLAVKAHRARKRATFCATVTRRPKPPQPADNGSKNRDNLRFYNPENFTRMRLWARMGLSKIKNREFRANDGDYLLAEIREVVAFVGALQELSNPSEE